VHEQNAPNKEFHTSNPQFGSLFPCEHLSTFALSLPIEIKQIPKYSKVLKKEKRKRKLHT